ncbi:hypothetical protein [Streptomyces sp. NBC_01615]|uniref:hypothetical protein n=1 Tax=Streptomyces sp. NBC_01615 TaxID=2975898 RepID=UPI0038691130
MPPKLRLPRADDAPPRLLHEIAEAADELGALLVRSMPMPPPCCAGARRAVTWAVTETPVVCEREPPR